MNPYHNLPPEQRRTQRLVDQNNADARLWKKLEPNRRARRELLRRVLPRKKLKELDLEEFAAARPPVECVGDSVEGHLNWSQIATASAGPGLGKATIISP